MRAQRRTSNTANRATGHCMRSQYSPKARITGTATSSAEATHRKHAWTTRLAREFARRSSVDGGASSPRAAGLPLSAPGVSCSIPALPLLMAACTSSHVVAGLAGAPSSSSPPSFWVPLSCTFGTSGSSIANSSPNQACTCLARVPGGRDRAFCIHSSMCDAEAGSSQCSLPVSARVLTAVARACMTSGFDRTAATSLATPSSPSSTTSSIEGMGPCTPCRLRRRNARAPSSSTPSSLVASTSKSLDDETSQVTTATKNCIRLDASGFVAFPGRLDPDTSTSSADTEPERTGHRISGATGAFADGDVAASGAASMFMASFGTNVATFSAVPDVNRPVLARRRSTASGRHSDLALCLRCFANSFAWSRSFFPRACCTDLTSSRRTSPASRTSKARKTLSITRMASWAALASRARDSCRDSSGSPAVGEALARRAASLASFRFATGDLRKLIRCAGGASEAGAPSRGA
mmetsp:Transcript_17523/g.50894  ORF Transcript_17523/g.50894 Transcript_17523/m.50894 type:complete len:466 (-) Transcript_17523:269-1666(-)